jgi:hypothetical protein
MLRLFHELGRQKYMTVEEAGAYDQRPFRSMLIRGYVAYAPRRGFHLTRLGEESYLDFISTDIHRKHMDSPLTSYFDAAAYGLDDKRPKRKKAAA